jgi:hypothetical protein
VVHGRIVASSNEQIELPQIQKGTYMLQVRTTDGITINKTILKE